MFYIYRYLGQNIIGDFFVEDLCHHKLEISSEELLIIKHAFSMLYTLIKQVRKIQSIYNEFTLYYKEGFALAKG